ncbi:MAG: Hsp70 family protein, partial [Brevinematia bacterium]
AQKHAEEDRKRRELIELRNQADNVIYTTEKLLKEQGDKISQQDRLELERAINNLKEKKESEDINTIKKAMEDLTNITYRISQELYKNVNTSQSYNTSSQSQEKQEKQEEKVVDTDYKVVDEDKK